MRSMVERYARGLGLLSQVQGPDGKALGTRAFRLPESIILRVDNRVQRAERSGNVANIEDILFVIHETIKQQNRDAATLAASVALTDVPAEVAHSEPPGSVT